MKEAKNCTTKDLQQLFTKINTILLEDDNCEAAQVVDRIEPILTPFIDEFFDDVERVYMTSLLWTWFMQWREKCGDWDADYLEAAGIVGDWGPEEAAGIARERRATKKRKAA